MYKELTYYTKTIDIVCLCIVMPGDGWMHLKYYVCPYYFDYVKTCSDCYIMLRKILCCVIALVDIIGNGLSRWRNGCI